MNTLFYIITSITLCNVMGDFLSKLYLRHDSTMDRFKKWIQMYDIDIYDSEHFYTMYNKWVNNDKFIELTNAKNFTYTLGHNQLSGMDSDDYHEYLLKNKLIYDEKYNYNYNYLDEPLIIPSSIDWVKNGAVTYPKDQGQCGSCWSFSTTGALEGAYYIKYGILESFSEQQLVDCDNFRNGGKDFGCNGGLMDNAFTWIMKNGGLCSEDEYPYSSGTTEKSGTCDNSCEVVYGSEIVSYMNVIPSSDSQMILAIVQQPVSIAIEADQREFQLYKSGVFTGTCGVNLDHGVLVVGYGTMDGNDYYLVKNSWGEYWGQDGYIYLGRGTNPETGQSYNDGNGQCGILMEGSYPVL